MDFKYAWVTNMKISIGITNYNIPKLTKYYYENILLQLI
jgi:hypothetical protein